MTARATHAWQASTPPWRTVSVSPAERVGGIRIGLAAVAVGGPLPGSAGSALAVVLKLLLVPAGLDTLVTRISGRCPLHLETRPGARRDHQPPFPTRRHSSMRVLRRRRRVASQRRAVGRLDRGRRLARRTVAGRCPW